MPACAVASNKWTVFIYMLADNDLEQYALLDMEVCSTGGYDNRHCQQLLKWW